MLSCAVPQVPKIYTIEIRQECWVTGKTQITQCQPFTRMCLKSRRILTLCFKRFRGKTDILRTILVHHQNALGCGNHNEVFHANHGDRNIF
jgi:hypothetical protein